MSNLHDAHVLALLALRVREIHERVADIEAVHPRDGRDGIDGEVGPRGERGERGERGARGETGIRGEVGQRGQKGDKGEKGDRGEKGEKGDQGESPAHQWDGSRLRFKKPNGRWGEYVDLLGPSGGGGGGSYFNPDVLPEADSAPPEFFIVRQANGWRRASYAQMQAWFHATPAEPQDVVVNGDAVTVGGEPVTVTV